MQFIKSAFIALALFSTIGGTTASYKEKYGYPVWNGLHLYGTKGKKVSFKPKIVMVLIDALVV